MATSVHFLTRLDQILVYKKGDQRAPHKPLYLLLCIAALQQGLPRLRKFDEVSQILGEALCRFGPRVQLYILNIHFGGFSMMGWQWWRRMARSTNGRAMMIQR